MRERRYDIDWLRIIAMLTVFLFHNSRFFDSMGWHLKNPDTSFGFTILTGFINQWNMPLFFLLSGAGSWFALEFRNSKEYLWERAKRLLIPYYLIGFFIIIPPQFYFEQTTHSRFAGNFLQFIPYYFSTCDFMHYWTGHLWFLYYLFIFSLICLPLMNYLKSEQGRKVLDKVASLCSHRGGIYLFVFPIALGQLILRPAFSNHQSWADTVMWIMCFLIGYIVQADDRFFKAIRRDGWIGIVLGVGTFTAMAFFILRPGNFDTYINHPSYTISYSLYQVISSLNSWCMIVFLLSMGALFLNFKNKILSYCNEVLLPFFILHQTIILLAGFLILNWNTNLLLKYFVLMAISFPLIILIYELLIRRIRIMRFLFGMKENI